MMVLAVILNSLLVSIFKKKSPGVEILSIDETVGLGMNAKNKEFRDQYIGKKVDRFEVVKAGKQSEDEVDLFIRCYHYF